MVAVVVLYKELQTMLVMVASVEVVGAVWPKAVVGNREQEEVLL